MKINIQPTLQTPYKNFFSCKDEGVEINQLIVPIYQREYDWEEDRIVRMLSDIDYYLDDKDEGDEDIYFLGAVILEIDSDSDYEKIYEVVDGQQRLTTFYLMGLLHYLISQYRFKNPHTLGMKAFAIGKLIGKLEKIFKDSEKRLVFGKFDYELLDLDRNEEEELPEEFLFRISNKYLLDGEERVQRLKIYDPDINEKLRRVIENSDISISDKKIKLITDSQDNPYAENLETIFNYLMGKFYSENKLNDKILEEIQSQLDKYLKNSGMALIKSENKDDSFKLFEVLNDTARKLTVLDLLKNYFVEHLKEDYSKESWRKLKDNEEEIKGVNLVSDVIKSEGYAKSTYEYSYLSNKIEERPEYYRKKESAQDYFRRLSFYSKLLNEITNKKFFKGNVLNNSLLWNLSGIHNVKFHWGRQVMIAFLNLSNIKSIKDVIQEDVIWNSFDISGYKKISTLNKFYLISSDLLFKIGLVGKVNNLSSKALPETGKEFLNRYHNFLNKGRFDEKDLNDLIDDLKSVSNSFFSKELSKFENNLDLLNYQNNSHKNIMKVLLYILYNKGENGSYSVSDITLEHIEPQRERSSGYFEHDERNRIVNSFGNMILLGSAKNSSFGNLSVKEKIDKSSEMENDAFINHSIFQSLNTKGPQAKSGVFDKSHFDLLLDSSNFKDDVPTESFFENRKEFYKKELVGMIFKTDRFLLNPCIY
ncbi:DUF262 domain-containing protein [Mangrovimonas xylaniphaga]|uniref:DUF262 domain-containing protein n=1 Tax=Mangrovimonas xylaniphaga TaxID=1645915 RepID=UPI0006B62369|nr:DUF262 domain-containing protein [Mangrovimonas xylaniphaga]